MIQAYQKVDGLLKSCLMTCTTSIKEYVFGDRNKKEYF